MKGLKLTKFLKLLKLLRLCTGKEECDALVLVMVSKALTVGTKPTLERERAEDIKEAVDQGQALVSGGLAHKGVVLVRAEAADDVEEDGDGDKHQEDHDPQPHRERRQHECKRLPLRP